MYWQLTQLGVHCEVIAPSLAPGQAGDRVKTDRRDAEKLARCYRTGDLTAVWVSGCGPRSAARSGIDIGKKVVAVCVLTSNGEQTPKSVTRVFGTTVTDLTILKEWLLECDCTQVAMESTGCYWKPVFNILEESVEVLLANAQHIKNVPGRKTDVGDCQWLAYLLRHGWMRGSFIPPRPIRERRDLTRRRKQLVGEGTAERNRIQKVMEMQI